MKLSTIVAGATFFASNVLATDSDSIIIKAHCRLQFFYKITSVVSLSAYEYSGPKSSSTNFKDPLANCKRGVPYVAN
ncbi:hypothetical protein EYZ11_005380 [Aspergillus tanneri]|uniref:Uncharacterized protein n=1 Tax=Aspergillus tanneri TaxID=1220188 RepID=A0A4S3JKG7_9EURO|nr:hypothetical protein EYZ11_005380 [Aspergillus tanneri]